MSQRRNYLTALLLSLVVGVLTIIPYVVANGNSDSNASFGGFLINPIDGFSYLAKMKQGAAGEWLFQLPYAANPGPPSLVYPYLILLGHLSRRAGLSLISIFHAARVINSVMMFMLAYAFFDQVLLTARTKWTAFLLTLIGSGLGWVGLLFGLIPIDLWLPEATPFLTAYTNAHFPLASAALLAAMLAVLSKVWGAYAKVGIGFLSGLILGAVLPFTLLPGLVALGVWLIWESMEARRGTMEERRSFLRMRVAPFGAVLLGGLPWLVYDFWLSVSHPALSLWTAQNITPSPPLIETLLGYGLVLLLALFHAVRGDALRGSESRLLVTWTVVNLLLMYAPFRLQRRFALGLFFPMAALAAQGLEVVFSSRRLRFSIAVLLAAMLMVPSNPVVIWAGLSGAARKDSSIFLTRDEERVFEWMDVHLPADALVLAGPENGNRLPAFADVRVLYGHPMETPYAESQEALVASLYAWSESDQEAVRVLQENQVAFVLFGPREGELGEPAWLDGLALLFQSGEVHLYQVPQQ